MVALTGSVETGKHFARTAAGHAQEGRTSSSAARRRSSCSTTSSLESALETIAGTGYYNAGQDCTAATRVLAVERRLRRVVAGLGGAGQGS